MTDNVYKRRVTPVERYLARSPYSIVAMVARIKGEVTESTLALAVAKVQQRHPNLRVRVEEDAEHRSWFTSQGVGEIPIEVVPRTSADQWIQVYHEACRVPFEFEVRPAIRFYLVQSAAESELLIFCHHIICDGLSLAYLARDLMVHLGDPTREVEVLPDPVPVGLDNMPEEMSLSGIAKFFVKRINNKWKAERVFFTQQDYEDLNQAYLANYTHQMLPVELSEAQTTALVERCRAENVTVNSALTAAFVGAQVMALGDSPDHRKIFVGASFRDRLPHPAGEMMGFYAGAATLNFRYDTRKGLWDNARTFHRKIQPRYANKHLFQNALAWSYLEPSILEAVHFKRTGGLVPAHLPGYEKLAAFARRDDTVLGVLKRQKIESLERKSMGTAVTNLGRVGFPEQYGALELDRLIMNPGGAVPLVTANLVVGAVTCSGKLSLLLEYAEQVADTATMEQVRDKAMALLLDE
jgi:NRPS condensation-like uncharacterized protein